MTIKAFRRCAPAVFAVFAGALVNSAASAGSFGSVTVSDFRIVLTDLRPDDGIDPAMAFVLPTTVLGNKIDLQAGATPDYQYRIAVGSQPLDPISASVATQTAAVGASIGPGTVAGATTTVKLSGWAEPSTRFDDRSEFFARATLPANAMIFGNLSLTPWTSITFSFDLDMAVGTTGGVKTGSMSGGEFSRAIADFSLSANNSNQTQFDNHWLEVQSSFQNGVYIGKTDSAHSTTSITLANNSGDLIYAQASLFTEIWGFTYADPVPEPASSVLLVSGLALLVARRARRA